MTGRMENSMKYYIAYGSNLNKAQMSHRCPHAVPLGTTEIKDYMLLFRGIDGRAVATIEPCEGCAVPVAIWKITAADEKALDVYEGYPRLYVKKDFTVELNGRQVTAMAYVMTPGRRIGRPSAVYLDTILDGYADFSLDVDQIITAVHDSGTASPEEYDFLNRLAESQREEFIPTCPRCGYKTMSERLTHNALSRRADIYICDTCGTEEALCDFTGTDDAVENWYVIRRNLRCNERNA